MRAQGGMRPKHFEDYLKELRFRGTVELDTAVMVRLGDAELDANRIRTTLVLPAYSLPTNWERASELDATKLGLVFPIAKREGNLFDHIGVGRTANVDISLPLAQVSKYHAYFNVEAAGGYMLADAGSKNGTTVAGNKLVARTPTKLRDGEHIAFGPYTFLFHTSSGFVQLLRSRL